MPTSQLHTHTQFCWHVSGQACFGRCCSRLWNTAGSNWHCALLLSQTDLFPPSSHPVPSALLSTEWTVSLILSLDLEICFMSAISFPFPAGSESLSFQSFLSAFWLQVMSIHGSVRLFTSEPNSSKIYKPKENSWKVHLDIRMPCDVLFVLFVCLIITKHVLYHPIFFHSKQQTCPIPWDRAPKYDHNARTLCTVDCLCLPAWNESELLKASTWHLDIKWQWSYKTG